MHPILCQIGTFTIYSYGAMVAVAVVVCTFLLQHDARRKHWDPNVMVDLVFWVSVAGIIGSRLFFIILHVHYFLQHPLEVFYLHQGGLAWQGGLILSTVVGVLFIRYHKLPLLKTLDFVIPYAALGQSLGRIGCFFNGCCHGKPWGQGMYFPVHQQTLHPTQLYSAINLFLIFVILKIGQARHVVEGRIFCWYFILASFERLIVQFFRADYEPIILGLGIFQLINVAMIFLAFYADIYLLHRARRRA
ncbi:MAG TPA: prolipoprotein diacylglyceryl transferase [Candidatus Omnitrophota bacterium]|nr:prolipoprotein diacylglyceryl transferase [Candidatus Omnitrophota bacterium]